MSILSHLHDHPSQLPPSVRFLYTTRFPSSFDLHKILFFKRLCSVLKSQASDDRFLDLYLTGDSGDIHREESMIRGDLTNRIHRQRLSHEDLIAALGDVKNRKEVVAYVCGPVGMTDEVVELLRSAEGMEEQRVLCEKWW
jgi:ferredoxin-NADP reductase